MTSLPSQPNQVTYVTQTGYVNVPPSNDGVKKYADIFKKLGIIQLVLGVLSMVFGIAILAYAVEHESYYYWDYIYYRDYYALWSTGIWAGIFFLVSGILGVLTGKQKTRCLNIAALVMTIFSALAAAALLGLEIPGAVYAASNYYSGSREQWMVSCGIHSTLSVIAFTEFVVSIVHSAYCCGAQCCQIPAQQATQSMTYAYPNPVQQIPVTQLPAQPGTYIQGGPFMQPQPGPFIITSTVPQPASNLQVQQPAHIPQTQIMQQPPAYSTEAKSQFH